MKTMYLALILACCSCVGTVDSIESDPAEDVSEDTAAITFVQLFPCNDGNECTKDVLLEPGKCAHFNYTDLQSCGTNDMGHCNGNLSPAQCCDGCMMFVGNSIECRSSCPLVQACGPDGFCH